MKFRFLLPTGLTLWHAGYSQALDFTAVQATVDFSRTLQTWNGFGFNYVETAHTSDMKEFNQEYGGFSLLDEKEKQEIVAMVFGEDGLKLALAGQPGMKVAEATAMDSETAVTVIGSKANIFEAFRTTKSPGSDLDEIREKYVSLGEFRVEDGLVVFESPAGSVTTFFAKE